jgi:hypothetical protein
MVVNDDDRRRVVLDGVAEQLGHADDVGLEATDIDVGDAQNPIVCIDSNCNTDLRYLYPDRLNCTPKADQGQAGWVEQQKWANKCEVLALSSTGSTALSAAAS